MGSKRIDRPVRRFCVQLRSGVAWMERSTIQDGESRIASGLRRFPQRWAAIRMRLDSSLRWNDEDSTPVIPGEQRETRNPGAYNRGKGVLFLSSDS